jgi:anti-sigma factor RsiW
MKHQTLQQLLSAYVDGEISNEESALIRDHLHRCEECARSLQEIQLIRSDLRSVKAIELRPTFAQQLLRTLRQQREDASGWDFVEYFARRLVLALLVVVFIVVSIGSLNTQDDVIVIEPYLTAEGADSVSARVLTTGEVSKEDLLLAVSTR